MAGGLEPTALTNNKSAYKSTPLTQIISSPSAPTDPRHNSHLTSLNLFCFDSILLVRS